MFKNGLVGCFFSQLSNHLHTSFHWIICLIERTVLQLAILSTSEYL